ncbi:uncharacterized protein LOC143251955 isoform X2 [Tachypleus tridentatus]|uniref:uncharacterized protein LOC143251955 isoform X2 n=1 Tax=Tachypleus tridentatus TaxID=6853 RepID=UPI003FD5E149
MYLCLAQIAQLLCADECQPTLVFLCYGHIVTEQPIKSHMIFPFSLREVSSKYCLLHQGWTLLSVISHNCQHSSNIFTDRSGSYQ